MKKLMMTSEEYYARKDIMDEYLLGMQGCRNLAIVMVILLAMAIAASIWL